MKMLLSFLSIVAVTLAYPHTDTNGPKLSKHSSSNSSNAQPKKEYIATNLTEINERGNCQCVPYNLCDVEDIQPEPTGSLVFDAYCKEILDVCCKNPKPMTPISKVKRGCGYRNPQKPHTFLSRNSNNSGETPWVVALMVGKTTVGAGALVHPQVVLTTAHVPNQYSNESLIVRVGEWHTQRDKQRLKLQERTIENIKIHSGFIKTNLRNDIALLRLQAPVELADHINVICLPNQNENFDRSRGCIVNGWAKDDSGAVTLKKVEADILDSDSCGAMLQRTRLGKWFQLHESFVCAKERQGFTCKGDGGAPLVCPGDEAYKVCGLVAWGLGCGDDVPAVYTRVAMFREWVDKTMREWGFEADEWI